MSIAAGALGVAAEADLRDYFRLTAADALIESLGILAGWLGIPATRVSDNGDLAPHLLSHTRTAEGIPVGTA